MMSRKRFLQKAQWWSRENIDAYQNGQIRRLIEVAFNDVQMYQALMGQARLQPKDFSSVQDLGLLPIVSKETFRRFYPNGVRRKTGHRVFEVRTSGSTGEAFSVLKDNRTVGENRATFLLALEWAGWELGESHFQTGMTFPRGIVKGIKDRWFRCSYFSAFDLRDEILDRALEIIEKKNIRHVWGYPVSIAVLAGRARELGWNKPLKSVVTWGDNLDLRSREVMQTVFKTKVFDTYGCGEGFQVCAQCGKGDRYHVHDLDVIVEVVDELGNPVPEGEVGEIVLTRFHPGPMPLIRYKVGDLGVRGGQKGCDCNRQLSTFEKILGRSPDFVETPEGNRLIVHFFTGIFEHEKEIRSFQVEQDRFDHLLIRVVPESGYSTNVEHELRRKLWALGASRMEIDFEPVERIPLTSGGKRRFVLRTFEPRRELGGK